MVGRFPLYIDIFMSMAKYWIRLYNVKANDALLLEALAEYITMIITSNVGLVVLNVF